MENTRENWKPMDERAKPVSSFRYRPPSYEDTDPELMTITEQQSRLARYTEARRCLEPALATSKKLQPTALSEAFTDVTSRYSESAESTYSTPGSTSGSSAVDIRTAKALYLRKGDVKISYIHSRKELGRQKPYWMAVTPVEATIDTFSLLSGTRARSFEQLEYGSEINKAGRPRSDANSKASKATRNMKKGKDNETASRKFQEYMHNRPLPSPPTPEQEARNKRTVLGTLFTQCEPCLRPVSLATPITTEADLEPMKTPHPLFELRPEDSVSQIHLPLPRHVQPKASSLTLAIEEVESFSEINVPSLTSPQDQAQIRNITTATATYSVLIDARLLDYTADAMDSLLQLECLLREVPDVAHPHPSPIDAANEAHIGIQDVRTEQDLARYISSGLTTSPTIKDLTLLFTSSSPELLDSLSMSWIDKVKAELDEMLIAAEAMKVTVGVPSKARVDSIDGWQSLGEENVLLSDAVGRFLEAVEGLADAVWRGPGLIERANMDCLGNGAGEC
ncbi:hypothetical protein BJ508DRAFT_334292 [Ascobolus immersus RN42]|uniref:Uncharacterized protein n=1 Tax=Ascobolus immersus RN42 TaxID=1160509 RepID=A0A3N4HU72_ASCIM|nr:hypothetical protein BJ508DRAFT_334292 [Ascobolus immersus RN42]